MNRQQVLQSVIIIIWITLFLVGCGIATPDLVSEGPIAMPTPGIADIPAATIEATKTSTPAAEAVKAPEPALEEGRNALRLGDFNQAIEIFTVAIDKEPNNPELYYLRGSAYYGRYETLFGTNPYDSDANDFHQAIVDFTKAIELYPSYAEAYSFRGLTYAAFNEYEKALADYNKAISLKPELAEVYYQRAYLFEERGEKERAITDYHRFLELSQEPSWRAEAQKRLEALQSIPLKTGFSSEYLLHVTSTRNEKVEFLILDITNGAEKQLTLAELEGVLESPAVSPDGQKLAIATGQYTATEIIILDIESDETTQITNNSALDWQPVWSPDGARIAFVTERDGNSEIYVMKADGSEQTRLTNNSAIDGLPSWSPDGQYIVFASARDGNSEIYVMKADGSEQTRLTNNPADDHDPAWSPDNKYIAFISERDKNSEVYIMKIDGSEQTRLTNNVFQEIGVYWGSRK